MFVALRVAKRDSGEMCLRRNVRGWVLGVAGFIWLSLCVLLVGCLTPAVAQSEQPPTFQGGETSTPGAQAAGVSGGQQQPDQQLAGNISGTVIVQTGALAVGAQVELTRDGQSQKQQAVTGDNGQFSFSNVPPGPFHLTVSSPGFGNDDVSGDLSPGQSYIVPEIMLSVATAVTEVRVELSQVEVAQEEVKEQEKQRVLGFIPNFYVTYVPDPAPLTPGLKFQLAWRSVIDPFTFVAVGFLAGLQQASDEYGGYGQGAEGYARRFGADYGNVVIGTFLGSAILPSILKQDPRYFYKGTGSTKSRLLYALGNAVIAKGDNKKWQPNYSQIIGAFATGGISQLYYPASDRGGGLLVENAMLRLAGSAVAGIFQEFVLRRLTPHLQTHAKTETEP
jgi:Carboxypeptidase regulatory-like domain